MKKTIKQLRSKNILQKPVHTVRSTAKGPTKAQGRKITVMSNKLIERERIKKEFKEQLQEAFREIKLHQEGKIELPNAKDIVFD